MNGRACREGEILTASRDTDAMLAVVMGRLSCIYGDGFDLPARVAFLRAHCIVMKFCSLSPPGYSTSFSIAFFAVRRMRLQSKDVAEGRASPETKFLFLSGCRRLNLVILNGNQSNTSRWKNSPGII